MTFDDDFLLLNFGHRALRQRCKSMGIDWPPPQTLEVFGFVFNRSRMSSITDEQREGMTHVCRGAEYELWTDAMPPPRLTPEPPKGSA